MTVLVWVLGGAGLWVAAAAVLSLVLGRVIGRAQSERDSYDELRRARSAQASEPAPAPDAAVEVEPETSPIPLAMPRQRAVPSAPAMPRIPQPRPQPRRPAERPASRGR